MLYIVLALIAVLLMGGIFFYNRFVSLSNLANEGWSGIDVQLKRRYDLIPNLIKTVNAYTKYEKKVLADITDKRTEAMKSKSFRARQESEMRLSDAFSAVFAVAENYPDLKADKTFAQLQNALIEIEGALQKARRYYNATVRDYNIAVDAFPSFLIAKIFRYGKKDYFEISEIERENVKARFK